TQRSEQLRRRRNRNTKHAEPSRGTQGAIALLPVIAAERIGDERDALSLGEPVELKRPVLPAVVNGFVQAAPPQEGVLAAARRSVDRGADVARDVDCGKPDATAGIVNKDRLPGVEGTHDDEQLPRGEIVHRNRRRLGEGNRGRFLEGLLLGYDNDVRIAT